MSKVKLPSKPARYTRQADILSGVLINDSPKVMRINELSPAIRAQIIANRLKGLHPVSVRWPTGEFALMFCESGTNMPHPENIIQAYYRCRRTAKVFPQVEQS